MTRRTAISSTALISLLERAAELLGADGGRTSAPAPVHATGDPTTVLVEAGWFMLQQLRIALGLTISDADADRLVPDLLSRAASFGTASASSVGVAASIVDEVRTGDPASLAQTILSARRAFGDGEIIAGACALTAALSIQIAERLALDPGVVHGELTERATEVLPVCRSTSGRIRVGPASSSRCGGRLARRAVIGARIAAPISLQH